MSAPDCEAPGPAGATCERIMHHDGRCSGGGYAWPGPHAGDETTPTLADRAAEIMQEIPFDGRTESWKFRGIEAHVVATLAAACDDAVAAAVTTRPRASAATVR